VAALHRTNAADPVAVAEGDEGDCVGDGVWEEVVAATVAAGECSDCHTAQCTVDAPWPETAYSPMLSVEDEHADEIERVDGDGGVDHAADREADRVVVAAVSVLVDRAAVDNAGNVDREPAHIAAAIPHKSRPTTCAVPCGGPAVGASTTRPLILDADPFENAARR